jgi:hypothetical protein
MKLKKTRQFVKKYLLIGPNIHNKSYFIKVDMNEIHKMFLHSRYSWQCEAVWQEDGEGAAP